MLSSLFSLSPFGSSSGNASTEAEMPDLQTFTISTITRGMCLETRPNGVSTGKYDSSGQTKAQLWTIEQSEDEKSVAFRNVGNGQYLRSAGKGDTAKVQSGGKTWWTLESGDAPGSWWLKSNDFGNYVNNYYGHQTPNNKVQMWSSNLQGWNYTMQWYITKMKAPGRFSLPESTDPISKKEKEELEAKEKELEEREKKVNADENEAVEREKAVAERERKAEVREKDLVRRKREQIEGKENVLTKNTQQREQGPQNPPTKEGEEDDAPERTQQLAELAKQLADTQNELDEVKRATLRQAVEFEAKEKRLRSTIEQGGMADSETARGENTKLQERINELEAQVAKNTASSPTKPSESREQNHTGLKPIVVQKEFGFLPRLSDSKIESPQRILPPATRVW